MQSIIHSFFVLIFGINILFADCIDDATGAYGAFGGCATVINVFGQTCDANFAGTNVWEECPVTCNTCPGVCGDGIYDWDETGIVGGGLDGLTVCTQDIPGCDLAEGSLALRPDGALLYNSSASSGIYGFQIYVEGTNVTAGTTPTGDAVEYLGNIQYLFIFLELKDVCRFIRYRKTS